MLTHTVSLFPWLPIIAYWLETCKVAALRLLFFSSYFSPFFLSGLYLFIPDISSYDYMHVYCHSHYTGPYEQRKTDFFPPLVSGCLNSHLFFICRHKATKKPPCENITVAYYFCEELIPYRTSVKGRVVTLGQFKELLTKKGNYRLSLCSCLICCKVGLQHISSCSLMNFTYSEILNADCWAQNHRL